MRLRLSFNLHSLLALSLFTVAAPAYVGQWHSYSDKSPVTALIAHGGFVYAGTQGGIRRVQPATLTEKDFGNLDGLLDPWITGFATDDAGTLWAAARDGFLYALTAGSAKWDIHGRTYAAQKWIMNDRAMLAAGSYLYLGTVKGLLVYDTRQKVSQLDVRRFGDDLDVPVLSLLRRGDTLYVGTSTGVFKARVYFTDPRNPPVNAGYANLADHTQWIKAVFPPDPGRKYNHLAFIGESLATYGPGTLLQVSAQTDVEIRAFSGAPLKIGAHTYAAWTDFTSAVVAGGKVFAGGNSGLAVSALPNATTADAVLRAPLRAFPRDTIVNIGANGDRVWGYSPSGIHALDLGSGGFGSFQPVGGEGGALVARFLRNVRVDDNGDVYLGVWGDGVNRFRNGQKEIWKADPAGSNCIFQAFPPNDPWTVVYSLSQPRNGSIFFTVFKQEGGEDHQLVHLNTNTGEVNCLDSALAGGYPHAVVIFADTLVGVATDRGVNFVVVREGASAPSVESATLWTLPGSANEAWDLAADRWGRPWVLIGDQLAYLDSLAQSPTKKLKPFEGFRGTNCKSLESDPSGFLWVGCGNGLFHVQTGPTGDVLNVRPYGPDQGLPSLVIFDVSVDPANGKVWVATDRGVGMLESSSQPAIPSGDLAVVVPYPNPFRPQHAFVIFKKLPSNSTLRIHNASGQVVRIFHPRDLTGTQALWDGKNESGKAVAPGVYLFSVTSGSTVQRGKVIVAR
jgi:hypothetical protein